MREARGARCEAVATGCDGRQQHGTGCVAPNYNARRQRDARQEAVGPAPGAGVRFAPTANLSYDVKPLARPKCPI